jgi:hypothetical protein
MHAHPLRRSLTNLLASYPMSAFYLPSVATTYASARIGGHSVNPDIDPASEILSTESALSGSHFPSNPRLAAQERFQAAKKIALRDNLCIRCMQKLGGRRHPPKGQRCRNKMLCTECKGEGHAWSDCRTLLDPVIVDRSTPASSLPHYAASQASEITKGLDGRASTFNGAYQTVRCEAEPHTRLVSRA